MTSGNDATRGAELMQQGIRQVREGRTQEAYTVFQEAVRADPNNEFGWIWLSITSPERAEKRTALERALQINPNSSHAREALRNLDAQPAPPVSVSPVPVSVQNEPVQPLSPAAAQRGLNARIAGRTAASAPNEDNLAQDLREPGRKSRNRSQPPPPVAALVGTRTAGQNFARAVRLLLLSLLLLIIIGIAAYYVYTNVINKPVTVANQVLPATITGTVTIPTALVTSAATISQVNTSPAVQPTNLAPTEQVATALAPTATPATALLLTPSPAQSSPTAQASPVPTQTDAQVSTLLNDAQTSIAANDFKTAIQNYKQALSLDPTNVQANFRLGLAYLAAPDTQLDTTDRYGSAISVLRTVTDLAPTWPGGFAQLGAAYAGKGDLANAINAYRTSLSLDPNGAERWLALAALYDRNQQPNEATDARNRAQNAGPIASPAVTASISASATITTAATTFAPSTPTVVPSPTPAPATTVVVVTTKAVVVTTLASTPRPTPTLARIVRPTATPTKKK